MTEMLAGGLWCDLATPFIGSTYTVDDTGIGNLVEQATAAGVTGLVVFGDLSEAVRLSRADREVVLETVLDCTDLPVVIDTRSLATAPAVDEARMAAEIAGDRLVAVIGHVDSADRAALDLHLRRLHEASGVGVVVQDGPATGASPASVRALAAAINDADHVCGVKVLSRPPALAVADLSRSVHVPIFGGWAGLNLVDELRAGAVGAITGSVFPELLVEVIGLWTGGDQEAARSTIEPYLPLAVFEQHAGPALAVRKEGLRRRGLIAESVVRPPDASLPELLTPLLHTHIDQLIGHS